MAPALETTLRPATAADLAAIVFIEGECFDNPWAPEELMRELMPDALRFALVAQRGVEVVGYLMAWRVVDQLHILNLAVSNRARRGQVGTLLLRAAAREALRCGLEELTLEVRRSNRAALAFYRYHGFLQVGLRPRYYPQSGEDALVLNQHSAALLSD